MRRVIGLIIGLVMGLTTVVGGVSAGTASANDCAYYMRVWIGGQWYYICIPLYYEIPTAGPDPCRCPPDFWFEYKFDPRVLERVQVDVLTEVSRGFGLLDQAAADPNPETSKKLTDLAQQTFAAGARQLQGTGVSLAGVGVIDEKAAGGPQPAPWVYRAGTDVGNGIQWMSKGSIEEGMNAFQQAYKAMAAGG